MQTLAEHFTTIRVLGEGGFGIVKLVKSRRDGQVCIPLTERSCVDL
jgi:serine/threonine protein kinase